MPSLMSSRSAQLKPMLLNERWQILFHDYRRLDRVGRCCPQKYALAKPSYRLSFLGNIYSR